MTIWVNNDNNLSQTSLLKMSKWKAEGVAQEVEYLPSMCKDQTPRIEKIDK
jgi:hypothetical protein